MARNEAAANQAMADAYGAYASERARWVQALGESRKPRAVRVQRDGIALMAFAALVAIVTAGCGALAGCAIFVL